MRIYGRPWCCPLDFIISLSLWAKGCYLICYYVWKQHRIMGYNFLNSYILARDSHQYEAPTRVLLICVIGLKFPNGELRESLPSRLLTSGQVRSIEANKPKYHGINGNAILLRIFYFKFPNNIKIEPPQHFIHTLAQSSSNKKISTKYIQKNSIGAHKVMNGPAVFDSSAISDSCTFNLSSVSQFWRILFTHSCFRYEVSRSLLSLCSRCMYRFFRSLCFTSLNIRSWASLFYSMSLYSCYLILSSSSCLYLYALLRTFLLRSCRRREIESILSVSDSLICWARLIFSSSSCYSTCLLACSRDYLKALRSIAF